MSESSLAMPYPDTSRADAGGPPSSRILIIDDHPLVRKGLIAAIRDEPDLEVCGETGTIREALHLIEELGPDLVIIDLMLEDGHGLDLIKQIHEKHESIHMLALSMHDESVFAERVLQAGALGFLHKSRAVDELASAIHRVLTGQVYLSTDASDRLLRKVTRGEPIRAGVDKLSDRELAVFQYIGQGLTTREIADKLDLSHKTVETHRERIKRKLQLDNAAALTKRAVEWNMESATRRQQSDKPATDHPQPEE